MAARRLREPSAQGFDSETGQVYRERTCKAGSMIPDWTWKTLGRLESSIERLDHAGPGSASPYHDGDVAAPLPMTCRSPLIAFTSSQLDSLRTWKVFASLFANQRDDRIENKRLVLSGSNMNVIECIKHIDSPSFHFITFLNLSDFSCSRSDLIHLSRLANLGMLTISTQDPSWVTLEDSIVRAWGRAASETGAFSRLRILVCRFQSYITAKSFVYLRDFPALVLVVLDQCRVSKGLTNQTAQQEWHAKDYSRLRSNAVDLPAWKDIYSGLLKKGALLDIEAMHKPFENDEDSEPLTRLCQAIHGYFAEWAVATIVALLPIHSLRSGQLQKIPSPAVVLSRGLHYGPYDNEPWRTYWQIFRLEGITGGRKLLAPADGTINYHVKH